MRRPLWTSWPGRVRWWAEMDKSFSVGRLPMERLREVLDLQLSQGRAVLPVTGGSMHPMLRAGDLVRLVLPSGAWRPGDIILYQRVDGQYVLHRIIKERNGLLLCCGDHQWRSEEIGPEQVLARAEARNRNGSWQALDCGRLWRYGRVWTALHPVRRPLLALRRQLGRMRKGLRRAREG